MKGMFSVVVCSLALLANSAVADDSLVCKQYGFTDRAEDFHEIQTVQQETVFDLTSEYVMYNGDKYDTVNPGWVGLDGLAITYHTDKFNKVLYLYVNEKGDREVGISSIENDSDTIFQDKAVFRDCNFKEEVVDAPSKSILRTSQRGVSDSLPVYVF